MCRRVQCARCGRPSFAGCGAHVEQVLRDVPLEERCQCQAQGTKQAASADSKPTSWLRRLFSW
jgi:hypothetical protein